MTFLNFEREYFGVLKWISRHGCQSTFYVPRLILPRIVVCAENFWTFQVFSGLPSPVKVSGFSLLRKIGSTWENSLLLKCFLTLTKNFLWCMAKGFQWTGQFSILRFSENILQKTCFLRKFICFSIICDFEQTVLNFRWKSIKKDSSFSSYVPCVVFWKETFFSEKKFHFNNYFQDFNQKIVRLFA